MKTCNILSAILSLLLLFTSVSSKAEITQAVSFDRTKLVLGQKSGADGRTYTTVGYDYNPSTRTEGSPQLPYKVIHLLVPSGVNNFSVSVTSADRDTIDITHAVYPAQPQQKTAVGEVPPSFVKPDRAVYTSVKAFPSKIAAIAGEGYFDGDKHILTIAVSPVQYEPLSARLIFYNSISVNVNYSSTKSASGGSLQPLVRNRPEDPGQLAVLQNMIENKESVSSTLRQTSVVHPLSSKNPKRPMVSTIPVYEYCIITSRSLVPAFKRLCGWKRMKGLDAGIIAVEDIYSDPNFTGDLTSGTVYLDNAGKLRQYLYSAWSNGTKYVFFGGDYTVVPIRYSYDTSKEGDFNIPSDLYYSDLNTRWTNDRPSNIDLFPEIYVGRLLCSNEKDVANYTEKLLRYEINPADGRTNLENMNYFKKAFYMHSDQMQDRRHANEKITILDSIFTAQSLFEEEPSFDAALPTFPTGNDAISEMNKGYGFFGWMAHGTPNAIGTMTKGINGASNCIVSKQGQYPYESANGLDNMTNFKSPGIVYSTGCTNMPFDDYKTQSINLAESFTVGGKCGGIAFLGNTRLGYIGDSNDLYNSFAKRIAGGERRLGIAESLSKVDCPDLVYVNLSHNLVGCPETEMWTEIPSIMDGFSIETTSANVIIDNNSGIDNWTCHVSGLFEYDPVFFHITTPGYTAFNRIYAPTYTTMFTRPHSLPFIPDLKLQSFHVKDSAYIFGTNVALGGIRGGNIWTGYLVLEAGADVTFEISGTMLLDTRFEVKKGASFELKPFEIMK